MSKKTKRAHNNQVVIQRLIEKYNVSRRFIELSLKNERTSDRAMSIKRDYHHMDRTIKETIQSL